MIWDAIRPATDDELAATIYEAEIAEHRSDRTEGTMSKVVAILENGTERDVLFSNGDTITQFYSRPMQMWVCIPENNEADDDAE